MLYSKSLCNEQIKKNWYALKILQFSNQIGMFSDKNQWHLTLSFCCPFQSFSSERCRVNLMYLCYEWLKNITESFGEFTETWDQYQNQQLKSSIPIPSELRLQFWS